MSYGVASALQSAVFGALSSDAQIAALVGTHVYDAAPRGEAPEIYVTLGDERVRDASDKTGIGAIHQMDIVVTTSRPGFASAKDVAAAVCDVLNHADLNLARGRLVSLQFERAQASRAASNSTRQIRLRFRARVEDQ